MLRRPARRAPAFKKDFEEIRTAIHEDVPVAIHVGAAKVQQRGKEGAAAAKRLLRCMKMSAANIQTDDAAARGIRARALHGFK